MNTIHVHISECPEAVDLEFFRNHLSSEVELTCGQIFPSHNLLQMLIDGRPGREIIQANPGLRWLIIPWTGIPPATRKLMQEFPHIQVHNLHYHAPIVAEMAITLLLAASRFLLLLDKDFRQNNWLARDRKAEIHTLFGKNALLLGFGHIGMQIGSVCHALGMHVYTIRNSDKVNKVVDYPVQIGASADLDRYLGICDALIISLPETETTINFLDARRLNLMKPSAVLVNVGRGSVVDQEALYYALKNGQLRAAGLDVWYNYPKEENQANITTPADFPFQDLNNIVMSPHRAGTALETEKLRMSGLAEMVNAAADGKTVPNLVDLSKGY